MRVIVRSLISSQMQRRLSVRLMMDWLAGLRCWCCGHILERRSKNGRESSFVHSGSEK